MCEFWKTPAFSHLPIGLNHQYCTFEHRDANGLSLVVIKENCNKLSLRLKHSGVAHTVDSRESSALNRVQ